MRYGEADRILHLYTPHRGRVSAIAKGVRRAKSRFGGRLEPFFRLQLVLYEGKSDLLTVTSAETLAGHRKLREHGPSIDTAARACDAVAPPVRRRRPARGRLPPARQRARAARRASPTRAGRANALAFRLKLLLAAGFAPQLSACATCGEREHLQGFSGAAGGVVCSACEAGAFGLDQSAHDFLVAALGRPLADTPDGPASARSPRRSGRSTPPSSTMRTSAGGPSRRVPLPWRTSSGSTTSPRARATCASCWEARAPTSPR